MLVILNMYQTDTFPTLIFSLSLGIAVLCVSQLLSDMCPTAHALIFLCVFLG